MKKAASFVFSACLVLSPVVPALAQSAQSMDHSASNWKKATEKSNAVIQVPVRTESKKETATFQIDKTKTYKSDEIIVKLKKDYSVESLGQVKETLGLSKKQDLSPSTKLFKLKANITPEAALKLLKSLPQVEYAEPNYLLQPTAVSDPLYGQLWGLKNTGQTIYGIPGVAGIDIHAETAWTKTKGNSSVVVAVIDTGVDMNHPDLRDRIWKNPGEIPGDGIDNDKNGYIDDVNGWDFYNGNNTVYDYFDGDEHGTHVSGTIVGTANTTGVIGIAPNVKIMPLKFIGPYGGYASDAITAINYAKAKGVKISSNSWGGYNFSEALYDAIRDSNSLFVAAAGNEGYNSDVTPAYPAAYDLPNILSVAAIDNTGNLAYFSNYGVNSVDVAAPGVNILSSVPGDSYDYYSGTSMATPHVSGAAALVLSRSSSSTPAMIKESIMKSVTPLSSLKGLVGTGGLLNAGKAVDYQPDNDIPGMAFPGTSVSNTVSSTTDVDDVYSTKLLKGEKITVTLSGAAGTDFDLYLYSPTAKTVKSSDGIVAYSEKSGTSSESFTYIAPEDGTYYLDVYAYKGAGSYTATAKIGAAAGTYENTAKEITYTGTWGTVSNSNVSGRSYASANADGSKAQFIFNGTGVSLKGMKNPQQGIVKVTIDGVSSEVSLYSTSTLYKTEFFKKTGMTANRHVVTIEWTGKTASGARKAATTINLDSITVY